MKNNQFRIIAGQWRSRRLTFPSAATLRPTTDRARETLFNWLAPFVSYSRCLDLFAGSGALSFEALSRGAAHVTMVERAYPAYQQLKHNIALLGCQNTTLIHQPALSLLKQPPPMPFDIVFIDPPFQTTLIHDTIPLLNHSHWLNNGAFIYIEQAAKVKLPELPITMTPIKETVIGAVKCHLIQYNGKT